MNIFKYGAVLLVSALSLSIVASSIAEAHSGGTNRYGCHTNHRTGDYHCH
jgi:hypothetical protein